MSQIIALGAIIAVGLGLAVWIIWDLRKAGRDTERLKQSGKVLDDLEKAQRARRQYDNDPDYRDELRDKYTRD